MACYPGQPALQQTVEDLAAETGYDIPVVGTGECTRPKNESDSQLASKPEAVCCS